MARLSFVAAIVIFLSLSVVDAHFLNSKPINPNNDPFYDAPKGYEDATPGTILGHRSPPAPLAAFGRIKMNLSSSHQIQYATTDSQSKPSYSITTVLVPNNANTSQLVSYQDFEDSAFENCGPSYALQEGTNFFKTELSKANILFEAGLLEQGFLVSISDCEGPKSAFGAGPENGMALLDSIRAVLRSTDITGIAPEDIAVTMWGYSGGSILTGWAAELHASYAPELKIAGAAIGGTVVNLYNTIHTINKGPYAGFAAAGINGLFHAYKSPAFSELMNNETSHKTRHKLLDVGRQCGEKDLREFDSKDIGSYFHSGLDILHNPLLRDIIHEAGIMGRNDTPQIPMYFYKSTNDEVDPVSDNDELVHTYCSNGIQSLQYVRQSLGSHSSGSLFGALAFLKDRFAGVEAPRGCTTHDVGLFTLDWKNLKDLGRRFGVL